MTALLALVFALIVVVAVAGFLFAARLTVRTGGLRPSWESPTEPEPEPEPYRPPAPRSRKASTPRGIRPPASPHLTTVQMTPECAEGMHALCPRTGGCECACDHDSKRIVAWNAAEYDQAHEEVPA